MVRSIFWFHPAVWWLVSRVQLARETVVDELSILATNARRTYLDTLLAFADDTGLASSPAFSARRHLFHRVMLLSQGGRNVVDSRRVGSCVLVLALAAGTVGRVKAFPLYGEWQAQQPQPPRDPQRPPRDPLSAEQHHAMAVMAWEKARRDTSLPVDGAAERDSEGHRGRGSRPGDQSGLRERAHLQEHPPAHAGQPDRRSATDERPPQTGGRAPHRGELVASRRGRPRAGAATERGVRRSWPPPGRRPSPTAPASPAEFKALVEQLKPVRVGGGVKVPLKIRDVKPVYPPIARAAGVQGMVILEILIDASGDVAEAHVLRSIPLLDEAALEAVKEWRFAPTHVNGSSDAGHHDGDGEFHAAVVRFDRARSRRWTNEPRESRGLRGSGDDHRRCSVPACPACCACAPPACSTCSGARSCSLCLAAAARAAVADARDGLRAGSRCRARRCLRQPPRGQARLQPARPRSTSTRSPRPRRS